MDDSRVKKASDLVSALVSPKAAKAGEGWLGFFSAWAEVAGERAAAHTRIADVDKGIVVVEADHPGWIQTLQFSQSKILAELKRRYPKLELRGISFRNARDGNSVPPSREPLSASELNAAAWSETEGDPAGARSGEEASGPKVSGELGEALERLRMALGGGGRSD